MKKTLTPEDVKNMPLDTAKAIYLKKFWNPIHGDAYNSDAKATAIFDTAVNKGLGGCKNILDKVFGKTFAGELWVYGQDLIDAVNAMEESDFLNTLCGETKAYIDARIAKYPAMAWAKKGWDNRAEKLLTLGSA